MKPPHSESPTVRPLWERTILGAALLSMFVATGPGILLVNRPETLFGFPLIYVWAVFWFLILSGLAVLMDRLVWRKDEDVES